MMFERGQEPDVAHLCVKGGAGLYCTIGNEESRLISDILLGCLIGDLSVFSDTNRQLNLIAIEETVFLQIGSNELNAVIENDAMVASSLLKTVASHLLGAAEALRSTHELVIKKE